MGFLVDFRNAVSSFIFDLVYPKCNENLTKFGGIRYFVLKPYLTQEDIIGSTAAVLFFVAFVCICIAINNIICYIYK